MSASAVNESSANWSDLDGAVNARDLGGLPLEDGGTTVAHRLIRSDNLQDLSPADVDLLGNTYGVRSVADLRTEVEIESEGPAPLNSTPGVVVHQLSLFPSAGHNTDVAALDEPDEAEPSSGPTAADPNAPVVLPWQGMEWDRQGAAGVYLSYLEFRADSVIQALRAIAHDDGATIVHCAAGKDRTGVVIALALSEVGVTREAIVADYAASAEHIEAVMARLVASRTYAGDLENLDVDKHRPKAVTMERFLDGMQEFFGGSHEWLTKHGWTDEDAAALRRKLTQP